MYFDYSKGRFFASAFMEAANKTVFSQDVPRLSGQTRKKTHKTFLS